MPRWQLGNCVWSSEEKAGLDIHIWENYITVMEMPMKAMGVLEIM